ncbi:primosomal protein N' [Paenibacillus selenitireducens]|uniref:Replication restart protein PriA n=1 Tax=Paenibacillus selenitireducens TaxID=1324314 RepID=A0A1T2XFG7_9BACL|nr:primosomal protein N' [Paenibacillus selenitireducens]OPA78578.1 primosomal protein N' [Paenibacillus selenitireducens]
MTRFAKVIVDVPSKQTNRPFDYMIPAEMDPWIEVGSRVGVPFGPRTVQGFVVGFTSESEVNLTRMKSIKELLDLVPPLSPDLVELGAWMSRKYVCHDIAALQSMIPTALKGKVERVLHVSETYGDEELLWLPEEQRVLDTVDRQGPMKLEQVTTMFPEHEKIIKRLLKQGFLIETQSIKDRVAKKKVKVVFITIQEDQADEVLTSFPAKARRQKEALEFLMQTWQPMLMTELLAELHTTSSTIKGLEDKGYVEIREMEVFRDPYADRRFKKSVAMELTEEQQHVYDALEGALNTREHNVFLLHGVTGSGKTEVYLQSIQHCISQGREAIVLVPEISLTPQMVERFKSRFGSMVAVLHSRLSNGERYDEWRKIRERKVKVAIGARSAIFAPFEDIGLVIIDEEHETSYKQEESPKYHARDVAVKRAAQQGAVVVLGSATPALESYLAAVTNQPLAGSEDGAALKLLSMPTRVGGRSLPKVHVVDLREELKNGNRSMFSRDLYQAIEDRLAKKEQMVLLLNRRGYSTFVMCRTCGYVAQCPECDIALTYHQKSDHLRCHYCGHAEKAPKTCPSCQSEHIRYFGTGTQRVEEELAKLFPGIRVIRMDVDTTTEKGSHEKLLGQFRDRQADVLLGTQMVAKGLDFPYVTLVGVITADSALNIPDFRAAERTFQLLTQVAGRAGRHHLPGEVYIQTYTPEHYSIGHASEHRYKPFAEEELEHRRKRGYPPYCKLILITFSHEQLPMLVRMSENFATRLKEEAQTRGWIHMLHQAADDAIELLGPVASPIPRIKNRYRFQCMLKYRGNVDAVELVRAVSAEFDEHVRSDQLTISVDVDPQMLM